MLCSGAGSWRSRCGFAFFVLLAVSGCGDSMVPATHLVPDQRLVEFPDAVLTVRDAPGLPILEDAWSFDLRGDTVAIADRLAGRVQVFNLRGEHLKSLGGSTGTGPDILEAPLHVGFAADGTLWVGDMGTGRLVRFSSNLEVTGSVPAPINGPIRRFAVDPVLGIVIASTTEGYLLAARGDGGANEDIPSEIPIPADLLPVPGEFGVDISRQLGDSFLLSSGGEGELFLVDERSITLWRIRLEYAPPRMVDIHEVVLPEWLVNRVEERRQVTMETFGHTPGLQPPPPFNSMTVTGDGVWLEPAGSAGIGVRGVLIPHRAGEVTVLWRGDEAPPVWKSRLRDGVAYLLNRTTLSQYEVLPTDSPP